MLHLTWDRRVTVPCTTGSGSNASLGTGTSRHHHLLSSVVKQQEESEVLQRAQRKWEGGKQRLWCYKGHGGKGVT